MASATSVRVRFCPSPTGNPHVGLVRTALFNWAFARHTRAPWSSASRTPTRPATPRSRYDQLLDSMRWLGFDWDEGPEVGGPHAPVPPVAAHGHLQGRRARSSWTAATPTTATAPQEELDTRRDAARAAGKPSGYDGHCRDLSEEQVEQYKAEGRTPIVRFRMPDETITFTDLVRGEITFHAGERPGLRHRPRQRRPAVHAGQPGRRRADGDHPRPARRGPALLHPAPDRPVQGADGAGRRQGHPGLRPPAVRHGRGQQEALQARPARRRLNLYRERGFLPEGLLNYLSLLGWSLSARPGHLHRWTRWSRPSTSRT